MNTEPAILIGSIGGLVAAALALAVAFGAPITPDQAKLVVAFIALLAPVVAGLLIRPQVTPNSKVAATIDSGELVVMPKPPAQ